MQARFLVTLSLDFPSAITITVLKKYTVQPENKCAAPPIDGTCDEPLSVAHPASGDMFQTTSACFKPLESFVGLKQRQNYTPGIPLWTPKKLTPAQKNLVSLLIPVLRNQRKQQPLIQPQSVSYLASSKTNYLACLFQS